MIEYSEFYKTMVVGDGDEYGDEYGYGMDGSLSAINSNEDAITDIIKLLTYMFDLTTDEDFDVNLVLSDIRTVLKVDVYGGLNVFPYSKYIVSLGTLATNEHTKRYINADLTDFVNNEVAWDGGCVPYEWAIASERTGEDISGWNVCDPN